MNRKSNTAFLFIIIQLLIINNNLYSSIFDNNDIRYGFHAAYLYNLHRTDFLEFSGIYNSEPFNNGTTHGFLFGIFAEKKLIERVNLQLSFDYSYIGGKLEVSEFIGYTEIKGDLFKTYTDHKFDTDLGVLSLHPKLFYYPFNNLNFRIGFGFQLGIFIQKEYDIREVLSEDAQELGFRFNDGISDYGVERNVFKGTLPNTTYYPAISLNLGYDIELSKNTLLTLNASYIYNIKNIMNDVNWKIHSVAFGVSISFSTSKEVDIIDIPETKEPLIAKKDTVSTKPKLESIPEKDIPIEEKMQSEQKQIIDKPKKSTPEHKEIVEEQKKVEVEKKNEKQIDEKKQKECCYLIFLSTNNKNTAVQMQNKLSKKGLKNISIDEWVNPKNSIKYFRVRSACMSSPEEANNLRNSLANELKQLLLDSSVSIKCD